MAIFTVILLFWVCYCGWYYTWFRYIAYFCFCFFSQLKKFLSKKWVKYFLFIIIIQLLPWIIAHLDTQKVPHFRRDFYILLKKIFFITSDNTAITIPSLLVALAITIVTSVIVRLVKASQYFLIAEFTDCTGPGDGKGQNADIDKAVKGISAGLQYEFGRVIYLLKNFEEHRQKPLSKDFNIVEYVVDIKEVKNWQTIVSDESIVKVGSFVDIHLNWVVKMFSKFLYGPIVSGSLHSEGDHNFCLIASMRGGGHLQSWRVNSSEIEDHEKLTDSEKIAKLAGRMAFRILSEIQDFGSSNWKAVTYYFDALLAYRKGLLSEKDKVSNLLEARKWAEKALEVDRKFSQCYYNLGNIYYTLDNKKAAEHAIRKALALKPQYDRCFYELAYTYFEGNQFAAAAWFCDQAIAINPTEAIYWNLRGVIEHDADNTERDSSAIISESFTITRETINFFKNASALSWKTLCFKLCSNKKKKWFKNLKEYSAKCLLNLAKVYRMQKEDERQRFHIIPFDIRMRALYTQTLFLKPGDNDTFMERGQFFDRKDDNDKAYKSFCKVFEDNQDIEKIEFWVYYLKATIKKFYSENKIGQKRQNKCGVKRSKDEIKNLFTLFLDSIAYLLHEKEVKKRDKDTYIHLFGVLEKWYEKKENKLPFGIDHDTHDIDSFNKFMENIKISAKGDIKSSDLGPLLNDLISSSLDKLPEKEKLEWAWAKAQKKLLDAKKLMKEEDKTKEVIDNLEAAIDLLKKDYANEIIDLGLYRKLAKAYVKQKNYENALLFAIHALWLHPCGKEEKITLREAYTAFKVSTVIKANSSGKSAYRDSFIEPPDSPDILKEIGDSFIDRINKGNGKKEDLENAEKFFKKASNLLKEQAVDADEDEPDKKLDFSNSRELGIIYFYWGLACQEKKDSESTISYFRKAARCGFELPHEKGTTDFEYLGD